MEKKAFSARAPWFSSELVPPVCFLSPAILLCFVDLSSAVGALGYGLYQFTRPQTLQTMKNSNKAMRGRVTLQVRGVLCGCGLE